MLHLRILFWSHGMSSLVLVHSHRHEFYTGHWNLHWDSDLGCTGQHSRSDVAPLNDLLSAHLG
jgi:hypothetical protein